MNSVLGVLILVLPTTLDVASSKYLNIDVMNLILGLILLDLM